MTFLIDACVWSLSLRQRPGVALHSDQQRLITQLERAIGDNRASIISLIRQEVLSGIREPSQFQKIQRLLAPFLDEELIPIDYIHAARLYNTCQDQGVPCGSIDMLIAAVAARQQFTVLTYDQALVRCLDVLGIPHL